MLNITIIKEVPGRLPKCKACGKKVWSDNGFYKIIIPSQKNGVWAHCDCVNALKPWVCDTKQKGSSERCISHVCEIVVSANNFGWLVYGNMHGFKPTKLNPTHRVLRQWVEIKNQSTKVVKKAFEDGLTVKVNGIKCDTYKDYQAYTTR